MRTGFLLAHGVWSEPGPSEFLDKCVCLSKGPEGTTVLTRRAWRCTPGIRLGQLPQALEGRLACRRGKRTPEGTNALSLSCSWLVARPGQTHMFPDSKSQHCFYTSCLISRSVLLGFLAPQPWGFIPEIHLVPSHPECADLRGWVLGDSSRRQDSLPPAFSAQL